MFATECYQARRDKCCVIDRCRVANLEVAEQPTSGYPRVAVWLPFRDQDGELEQLCERGSAEVAQRRFCDGGDRSRLRMSEGRVSLRWLAGTGPGNIWPEVAEEPDRSDADRLAELHRLRFLERSVSNRWETAIERLAHFPNPVLQRQVDALAAERDEIRMSIRALSAGDPPSERPEG